MKRIVFILWGILTLFSQSKETKVLSYEAYLESLKRSYFNQLNITTDSTRYSAAEKDKRIYDAYFSQDTETLIGMAFFEEDTALEHINLWVHGLYIEQHYKFIDYVFREYLPKNQHVILTLYKLQHLRFFLDYSEALENPSLHVQYYRFKALFELSRFDEILKLECPNDDRKYSIDMRVMKFKAAYYLQNFKKVFELSKSIPQSHLGLKEFLILGVSHLSLEEYDFALPYLEEAETLFYKEKIEWLQKSIFYQGYVAQQKKDIQTAKEKYDKVLLYHNTTQMARGVFKNLAIYYEENERLQEAITYWKKYMEVLPYNENNRKVATEDRINKLIEKNFFRSGRKSE